MKTAKLVCGIVLIVISGLVFLQTSIIFIDQSMQNWHDPIGANGIIVALCLLTAGVIAIVTHKNTSVGASIASIIICAAGALLGYWGAVADNFGDLYFWSLVCILFALFNVAIIIYEKIHSKKKKTANSNDI